MATLLFIMLTTYALGIAIMFLIPEGWMPKRNIPDRVVTEKGFQKKAFIIGGAIVMAIATIIIYFAA